MERRTSRTLQRDASRPLVVDTGWATEPAVRRMPAGCRIGWVLAGLTISAALVVAVFFVLIMIAFSMTDWN
jgi:hypothetical protein